ncbi:phenylacetate--CoA ligase family protein [Winogradskyella maritima]|uniref:Phenylacetate--CoA ligase family protein n=1 Tax=Winogradskyella maritima TaxID=1517766 RepID=A0ABV8AHU8_9FLAO|nr:phenylacetate--CoA ligase family protein [Winogradskyella maritima]
MRLFDIALQLKGFDIKKATRVLHDIQSLNNHEFEAQLNQKKTAIVNYHLNNNPFYKSLVGNQNDVSWNELPIITKRDLQRPLTERLSTGFTTSNVYINKTSGSSGDPFVFAKDKWCHAMTWAVIMNRFSWYNIDFNSSKQARFYGIPLDKKGYYKERLKDKMANRFRFSVFDLSDEAFEKALYKFKTTPFEYLNGYTSPVVQFAKFLKRKSVILKNICPSLKVCMVTSEMLFDSDRKLLETQFGVPMVNEYGASELDLIAFENPVGEFQLNGETLFVEIVDDTGKSVPNGEEGRIAITSLYNKAHPFIRYDIGDIGIISKSCTAQKPILKELVGRTNDIAILPSGKKAAGLTFYYITKSLIEDSGNVKEFVIEQLKTDQFLIRYVSLKPLSEEELLTIREKMIVYLEDGIQIQFKREEQLERQKSGKLKQFISHL